MRDYFAQLGKVIVQCSMFMYEIPFSTFSSCNIRGLWRGAPLWNPTADEDPGKRSVPGTGSVSTCTFAFFMHICFFYFKSSTRTFLHTTAQQLISPADRLLIKHILQFSLKNTFSSYNCLDSMKNFIIIMRFPVEVFRVRAISIFLSVSKTAPSYATSWKDQLSQ